MKSSRKKLLTLFMSGFLVLSTISFVGYTAYANNLTKQEVLAQKKADFDKQAADLLANSNATSEQGKKVKELGIEVGQLNNEVNPESPEDILHEKLMAYKEMNMIHENFYKNNPEIDLTDPKEIEVLNQIKQEKIMIKSIEKDIASKIKSADQILKDFDQATAALRK